VATFGDLSLNKSGNGYWLTATTTGLSSATSIRSDQREQRDPDRVSTQRTS